MDYDLIRESGKVDFKRGIRKKARYFARIGQVENEGCSCASEFGVNRAFEWPPLRLGRQRGHDDFRRGLAAKGGIQGSEFSVAGTLIQSDPKFRA